MKIIRKLKFKSEIFKSCNKSTFYKFFYKFFIYIKMSKNVWAKDYQGNKERLRKKSSPKILKSSIEEKDKNNNTVVNVTIIYQKMKNMNWLGIEKYVI